MGAGGFAYARIFDIAIVDGEGNHIEPKAPVQVEVKLLDADSSGNDFSAIHFAIHFKDEMAEPGQMNAETDGNTVTFTTDSFSAYAIVQGPSDIPLEWEQFKTMSRLNELDSSGLYIGTVSGYYLTLAGSVNFRTGEVYVNGRRTTLRDLFYSSYLGRGHTAAEAQAYVDGRLWRNSKTDKIGQSTVLM